MSLQPIQLQGVPGSVGPWTWLTAHVLHLEILNNLCTRGPHFNVHQGPTDYMAIPELLLLPQP